MASFITGKLFTIHIFRSTNVSGSVIFSNALIWNVMMAVAPPGIQNMAAPSYVL